ncbi:MAG: hypothetical protein JRD89_19490 [Deltaproteobacteria bacterium]|nr:hypothetical protein [Deltaproteobacteria bacterium]
MPVKKIRVLRAVIENEWGKCPVLVLAERLPPDDFKELREKGVLYRDHDYESGQDVWCVDEEKARALGLCIEVVGRVFLV